MQDLLQVIINNKEWAFSGIGVMILSVVFGVILKKNKKYKNKNTISIDGKNKINGNIIVNDIENETKKSDLYTDLLQKPIIQVGETIEATMKFVTLPFKFLGMTSEELEKKYRTFICNSINKIPRDKISQPSPSIAVKILDNVKYSFSESDELLTNMFSDLLSSSMNKDTQNSIHPSYIENLSNMTYVDAYICKYLMENRTMRKSSFIFFESFKSMGMYRRGQINSKDYTELIDKNFDDEQVEVSMAYLKSIDVISIEKEEFLTTKEYMKNINKIINNYRSCKFSFPHKSKFFNYIYNNYSKETEDVDYKYDFYTEHLFLPFELNEINDDKFCKYESRIKIDYENLKVKRAIISLTEYGYAFLTKCIKSDTIFVHNNT